MALTWTKFRGPGDVKFDNNKPSIDRAADGKTVSNATFSAPGEYILRVEGNDSTGVGGGGFQCCWSNAHVGGHHKMTEYTEVTGSTRRN